MSVYETILSKQEKKWVRERRITRLTDNKEVQIYPMGAERYLSSALFKNKKERYNLRPEIEGKHVLIIPAYGNSGFLFAQAGAKSITAYDKDPVTIAWLKSFKKYYNYREYHDNGKPYPSIGELLTALTHWYPPLITLPYKKLIHPISWILHPNSLRRNYIHYMVSLVQNAIQSKNQTYFELDKNIQFHVGTVDQIKMTNEKQEFDTAFVPYLLGVENGVEEAKDIACFIAQLINIVPSGHILVTPSQEQKEFYLFGKRYFITTRYSNIKDIPGVGSYFINEDNLWFHTQGLAVLGSS
ncbi:MAG: ABC transporter permease [Legionella longbeachae]|nr:ABC transporter permease [Legionella longbeachae]